MIFLVQEGSSSAGKKPVNPVTLLKVLMRAGLVIVLLLRCGSSVSKRHAKELNDYSKFLALLIHSLCPEFHPRSCSRKMKIRDSYNHN